MTNAQGLSSLEPVMLALGMQWLSRHTHMIAPRRYRA